MSMRAIPIAAGLILFALATTADAQGQSQGRGKKSEPAVNVAAVVVFRDSDRATFRDYFVGHKITGQPLPPGIAKNVARGKPLPPGIAKRALPADLVLTIGPRVERGVTFSIVGDRVVALRSGLVIDVMVGVFK